MRAKKRFREQIRCGGVLIISMIFVLMFSMLAISIFMMSGTNLQASKNLQDINTAFSSAESGLEVFRYWLRDLSVPVSLSADQRLNAIANGLQSRLSDADVSNISVNYADSVITISAVSLDLQSDRNFTATIQQITDDTLQLDVTGTSGQVSRTIRTNFDFIARANPIFDYGVASKGALYMNGNVGLEVAVGSNVYIDGEVADHALIMDGKSEISGDVNIRYPYASVDVSYHSSIGGERGDEAVDNHVTVGVDEIEFPAPDVSLFAQYVQNVVDSDTDTSSDMTLDNIRITAGTNPTFSGNVTLRGIVFIEQPNIVTFTGNASVTGTIVGDGDLEAPSELNQIVFTGNVDTHGVAELPDEDKFADLKDKAGSFLLAPGFSASFGGNVSIDNGAIATNGISFSGNAGGNIQGTIINYSQTPVSLSGNNNLVLNHSGTNTNPAGFTPVKILEFVQSSYTQIANACL